MEKTADYHPQIVKADLRLSLELTDGCNLRCVHCFKNLEKAMRFLDPEFIQQLLDQLAALGIRPRVGLTGGEPTLHPRLDEILATIAEHDLKFSLVTNGMNFAAVMPILDAHRDHLDAVSFSLDGATEPVNDGLRGRGSFRHVFEGLELCRERGLATQINFVVTRSNRNELIRLVELATNLGCRALGLAHCKPTPDAIAGALVMDAAERHGLETDIADLQRAFRLPILLAGDHWDPDPLARCPQLEQKELHVDVLGRLMACCELSAYRGASNESDVVADLKTTPLAEAMRHLEAHAVGVVEAKANHLAAGHVTDADLFICTRCLHHYGKVADNYLDTTRPRVADPTG